jgi:HEAT repeat protein
MQPAVPRSISDILVALDSPNAVIRRDAVHVVAEMGSSASVAVPALERALRQEAQGLGVTEVNWVAIDEILRAFSGIGAAALPTLSSIVASPWCQETAESPEACSDADVDLRRRGFVAIGTMGRVGVPTLLRFLREPDWWLRFSAASTLAWLGPEAKEAAPALRVALRDTNESVRRAAGTALSRVEGQ